MIFGEKFYPALSRLSPWRQSLYALVLAQRQFPNFALWASMGENRAAVSAFNEALKALWNFHQDKFNHVNLEVELSKLDPFIPEPEAEEEDVSVGTLMAINAMTTLTAAFDAILMKEGNEAEIASKSSLSCVVLTCEQASDEELDDDALREMETVDNEVNFQVSLYELLSGAKREKDLNLFLLKLAFKERLSNVGISYEDAGIEEITAESYRLPDTLLKEHAKKASVAREKREAAAAKAEAQGHKVYRGVKPGAGREKRRRRDVKRTLR